MASAREQMKTIEAELQRVRSDIEKLRVEEELRIRLLGQVNREVPKRADKPARRTRSPSIKPVVLDIMHQAGHEGATTAEVDSLVRQKVPSVAKDTVGSILSRLKSDGVLVYWGERYYEKQFAPKDENPFDRSPLRAVT